jgi:hypothetical protein
MQQRPFPPVQVIIPEIVKFGVENLTVKFAFVTAKRADGSDEAGDRQRLTHPDN